MFHLSNTSSFEEFVRSANNNVASAHFYVSGSGAVIQMVDVENRAWHAYEASHYYFGVVHECIPGEVYLNNEQLRASAALSGQVLAAAKTKWGVSIPIIRAPGAGFSPGFKDHKDGLGAEWNKNMHTDGLTTTWTWAEYLSEVHKNLEDDEMALFEDKAEFRNEVRKAITGVDRDGNANLATEEILIGLQFLLGMNLRLGNSMKPSESGPKQRGWDLADTILTDGGDDDSLAKVGKLIGTVTFGE